MTVANCLTLLRLLLVPVFIYFFAVDRMGWALATFCVAGFTDLIDGTVARLLKQPSNWGALLDPIADKLLLETSFACLVYAGVLPLWFFLLALARDIMIMSGIAYLKWRHIAFPYRALWSSKWATLAQIVTIVAGLVALVYPHAAWQGITSVSVVRIVMLIAAVLIVTSGALYVRLGLAIVKNARSGLSR